jgi:hypothetical protein
MKGAMAEPLDNTINTPSKSITIMIGRSQYFFLILKNDHNSLKNDIFFLKIDFLMMLAE